MPTKCRYVRPGGPRSWDSAKLRSLACSLVRKGISQEAICDAISECVDCSAERESKCQKEKQQVQALVRALEFTSAALEKAEIIVNAVAIAASAAALIARFLPPARPAAQVLSLAAKEAAVVQAQVRASIEYAKLLARLQGAEVPRELARLIQQ